ncbi:cytochrome c3 family protein [Desulfobacterota bacterium M19]
MKRPKRPFLFEARIGIILLSWLALMLFICPQLYALTNDDCADCHGDKDFSVVKNGKKISLYVDFDLFKQTVHAENGCLSCHEDADVDGDEHPVLGPVKCANCHDKIAAVYEKSSHSEFRQHGDMLAPRCSDCHTRHAIFPPTDKRSSVYKLNIPYTCGKCHREGSKMTKAEGYRLSQHNIVENYSMSIHGRGLFVDGLLVTAVCSDCHTAHNIRGEDDPLSSVNRKNILSTCGKCHVGIVQKFKKSVHSSLVTKTKKRLPVCTDCHTSHTIKRPKGAGFRAIIASECGNCHEEESKTYLETYHGRASLLRGGTATAKCSDCHGSHYILPASSPDSTINKANLVKTCSKCHPKANAGFVEYLPHADYHQKGKYPYLYYTFLAMTGLLVGTFSFFGIHTLLWLGRSLYNRVIHLVKYK